MSRADPYSAARIGRGVVHLVGGKAITSVAGIGTFLLLVGALPVEQFAAYSVLFALVELVDAVTGVGLAQILARYVPEAYVGHRHASLRRLVGTVLALRLAVLAAFVGAVWLLAPRVAPLIGLDDWEWAVRAYLAVVLTRVVAMTLFGILESMLHQGIAQLGMGLVTASRFGLLAAAAAWGGGLELGQVIAIELATDLVGCAVMAIGLWRTVARARDGAEPEAGWLRANRARMVEFGLKGYVQHLLILPYGGAVNRLVVGGALSSAEVALFGFAQSVADLMERYLPVRLLAGVIRPVLTARYVRDGRFSDLELASGLIFKINAIVICAAAVVIHAGGRPLVDLLTRGKYGDGGVPLLLLMCLLVLMYSLRHMLDQVCQAVERNEPLIWSNAVIMLSVLPGMALLPVLGVYAMPVANFAGLLLGCAVLTGRLRAAGHPYRHDHAGLAKMLGATGAGLAAGAAAQAAGLHWIAGTVGAALLFAAAAWALRIPSAGERELIASIVASRRGAG